MPNHNADREEWDTGYRTTELRANALGLPAIVMQGVTHIAPAVGMVLTIQFITSLAGVTSPLSYFFAFLIVLLLGASLTQLAKHLPSAGGYYTYVSRTWSCHDGHWRARWSITAAKSGAAALTRLWYPGCLGRYGNRCPSRA